MGNPDLLDCQLCYKRGFSLLARRQILNIAEQRYARTLEELVLQSFRLPDPRARLASKLLVDVGVGGLMGGCQRGAITAISFAYAATAVVGGIGAAAFLLWSETWLTLLVLVFVGFAALFLYPLTLRAAKSAKNAEEAQRGLQERIAQARGAKFSRGGSRDIKVRR